MKVKLEITEGCIANSYTIDGIEYGDLIDKESSDYNPEFVYDVLDAMTEEICEQQKDNHDLITLLNDVVSFIKLENSRWFFERLFEFNKNIITTDSYRCEQCGDTVITRELTINIEE